MQGTGQAHIPSPMEQTVACLIFLLKQPLQGVQEVQAIFIISMLRPRFLLIFQQDSQKDTMVFMS